MSKGQKGLPPWHMWGSTLAYQWPDNAVTPGIGATGPTPLFFVTPQLVNADYGRPENWQWFFAVQPTGGVIAGGGVVGVNFQLTLGLGRASVVMPFFTTMTWAAAQWNNAIGQNQPIYGSETQLALQANVPAVTTPIKSLAAQSVRVQAQCFGSGTSPGVNFTALISAMVAPSTHIRPEWFEGEFPGGEDHGR